MSEFIRQGSNQTQRLDRVLKGDRVIVQGSNGTVKVTGDVQGYISVQGSNPEVKIGGRICKGATVILQGANATLTHHGRDSGTSVTLQGSNAEERDLGGYDEPKAAPKHNTGDYGFGSFFGSPRSLGDFAVDSHWDYTTPEAKPDRRELQVQKSGRPRELWGT